MSFSQTASQAYAAGRAASDISPLPWFVRLMAPIVHRRRNAKAAVWLAESPDYLLADIGIDRSDIGSVRRTGMPAGR